MLALVDAPIKFELPKYPVGSLVIKREGFCSEHGLVVGYIWNLDGSLLDYQFAPLNPNSIDFPFQPVVPERLSLA